MTIVSDCDCGSELLVLCCLFKENSVRDLL